MIAAATILLASDPRTAAWVAPDAARWCRQLMSPHWADRLLARSAASTWCRPVWHRVEALIQPGITLHFWHRKRWIEARCRDAIAAGVQHVVVIGAGFDTLALRLAPVFPEIEFVEVDHPATQRAKLAALRLGNHAFGVNLRFIAADLGSEALPSELLDRNRATLFIAEGLLMYLRPQTVDRLLSDLGASAPGSRVIFSFMLRWPDGSCGFRPRSRWVERWLASRQEPFTWSIAASQLEPCLRAKGLAIRDRATAIELAAQAGAKDARLEGEELVLCEASGLIP